MSGWSGGGRRARVRWLAVLALAAGPVGCRPAPPEPAGPARFDGTTLVVGVAGDPALLKSVAAQQGEWLAQTGSEVDFRAAPVDPAAVPADVDILLFDAERIGDLVDARALAALLESLVAPPAPPAEPAPPPSGGEPAPAPPADPLRFAEVVPAYRDGVSKYGPDRFGLPIGGSALVVAFRRPAFADPKLVEAAQAAGLALEPPKTWDQFDALARFFHGKDLDGNGQPDFGVALAWGKDPEGVGDATFLARAAASALHPDQFAFLLDSETTEPRVATPPFVEALAAIVGLRESGPPGAKTFDADAARAAFRSGRVALLVDRAERAGSWGTGQVPIGVAPLPGSDRVYDPSRGAWEPSKPISRPSYLPSGGGWLVGVAAKAPHRAAAEAFARYLAGPETADRLRAERDFPMLAVRAPQLARGLTNPRSAPGVEARTWADAVQRTLTAPKVAPGLRLPGAKGYLADLAAARVEAVDGRPAAEALQGLAAAWSKRNQALGLARQTWHHRRGLNGPTTSPEPPPR